MGNFVNGLSRAEVFIEEVMSGNVLSGIDLSEFRGVSDKVGNLNSMVIYVIAGFAILLSILILVWLLVKLSNYISIKKGKMKKREKSEEEELFGD